MKHLLKGKRKLACLLTLLIASFCLLGCFFYFRTTMAYEQTSDGTQAEIMASSKKYTIKPKNKKYYCYDSNGNKVTTKGWEKNGSGQYTYYVGDNGYVTIKIEGGIYYKWNERGKFYKQTISMKNCRKTIEGKVFYVDNNKKIDQSKGWKKKKEKYSYYVGKNGCVRWQIKRNGDHLTTYFYEDGTYTDQEYVIKAKLKRKTKKLGDVYFYVDQNGYIVRRKGWKKNSSGQYTYYVGEKGNVDIKVNDKKNCYFEWKNGKFTEKTVTKNAGEIVKIKGKLFFVNKNGKITKGKGWYDASLYTFSTNSNPQYYVTAFGIPTYYKEPNGNQHVVDEKTGEVNKEPMKNNTWNGNVYVKNNMPVINDTISIDGYKYTFDESGHKVDYKIKNGKIVRSDNNDPAQKGKYKINGVSYESLDKNGTLNKLVCESNIWYKVSDSGKKTTVDTKKDGWKEKNTMYVKDGIPVSNKTIKITNFYYTFDQFGNLVTYKKKDGQIVRSDNGKAVNKEGAYKIGSTIYYCTKDGKYKTSGTVTIGKTKYTVGKDGKCTEKADPPTTEGSTTEKSTTEEATTEEATTEKPVGEHVHQWSPLDKNGKALKNSEVINHKAKTEKKDVMIADEWTEWRPSEDEKAVCLICVWAKAPKDGEQWEDENGDGKWSAQVEGRYYFKDYCFDTADELFEHDELYHNGTDKSTSSRIYTPIHHPAQYENRDVITEEAWDEWYEYWRCTECGEKMTVRVIKGKDSKGNDAILRIPDNSGCLLDYDGKEFKKVSKGKPYPSEMTLNGDKITASESMKNYGFCYLGSDDIYNRKLDSNYLLLLKDHDIDY